MLGNKQTDLEQSSNEQKKILFTPQQLGEWREQCKTLDTLRAMPDAAMLALGGAATFAGPLAPALEAIPVGYGILRQFGWHPAGERLPICEAVDDFDRLQRVPQIIIPEKNPLGESASIGLTPAKKEVNRSPQSISKPKPLTENFTEMGVSPRDQKKIIKAAAKNLGLPLNELEKKIDKVVQWQEQQQTLQTFQEIEQALGLFVQLGALTGCKELQQFATFAQAGVQVAQSIVQLTSGFALGPIVGIGSAILTIFSLFMKSGPSPTEIILKQIGKLSDQINGLQDITINGMLKNAKMQQEIMRTVTEGFSRLSQQIDRQLTGLRVELNAELQDIHGRLDFLIRYQQHAEIAQSLQRLRQTCGQVELYSQGVYGQQVVDDVQRHSRNLLLWAKNNASDGLLTGCIFLESKPFLSQLEENLQGMDEKRLNFFLGFFATYAYTNYKADFTKKEIKIPKGTIKSLPALEPDTIPNPEVWFQAVQSYIDLQTEFPQLDVDPDDQQLEKMIAKGQCGLDFVNRIAVDQPFWGKLLDDYYDCLEEIRVLATQYAKKCSFDELKRLNTAYRQRVIVQQPEIKTLDLLDAPQALIETFNKRSICHLPGDVTTQGRLQPITQFEHKKLGKEPIYNALHSKLPSEFLCAEYLERVNFSTQQASETSGFNKKIHAYLKAEKKAGYVIQADGSRSLKEYWGYPDGVQRTGGKAYVGAMGSANLENSTWTLPISLTLSSDTHHPVVIVHYTGEWKIFQGGVAVYLDDRSKPTIVEIDGEHYARCDYCSPAEIEAFDKQLAEFVRDYWNDPKGKPLTQHVERRYSDNTLSNIKQEIDDYYLEQRKSIVSALTNHKEARNEHVVNFSRSLSKLNTIVQFIQWYAHLIGKDKNSPALAELITSKKIIASLTAYERSLQPKENWLACITQASENRITYQTLQELPDSKQLPLATSLLISGQLRLRFYQAWKATYKKQFPTLSQFIDAEVYQRNMEKTRAHLFQGRVYQEFRLAQIKDFNDARFALAERSKISSTPMDKSSYEQHYQSILKWCVADSTSELVTEYLSDNIENLDSMKVQQLTEMHLKSYGWACNIRSLMKFAKEKGGCKFIDEDGKPINPVNFVMWDEGASAYLNLITFNPDEKITQAAKEAGNDVSVRVKAMSSISQAGDSLKRVLSTIGQSFELFDYLFERYLEILNEPYEFIKMKLGNGDKDVIALDKKLIKKGNKKETAIDVYRLLATDGYQGARDKLLDQLSTYAVWTMSYLEMVFGYDVRIINNKVTINNEKFTLFTDKEEMLKYLKVNNDNNRLEAAFEEYMQHVERLHQIILVRIAYAKDLSLFHHYLQTCMNNNEPITTLKLHGKMSLFTLTVDKMTLIREFLDASPNIHTIEVDKMPLDDTMLADLMRVLVNYPHIKSIKLSQCSLQASSLSILKNNLPYFSDLNNLDLSNNLFTKDSCVEELFDLVDLLQTLPNLTQLNLANNKLGDQGIAAVVAALGNHKNLTAVDLSGNVCESAANIQEALITLFQEHPNLIKVSLENMKLKPADLAAIVPAAEKLTKLQEFNLNGNLLQQKSKDERLQKFLQKIKKFSHLNLGGTQLEDKKNDGMIYSMLKNNSKKTVLNLDLRLGQPALDQSLQILRVSQESLQQSIHSNTVKNNASFVLDQKEDSYTTQSVFKNTAASSGNHKTVINKTASLSFRDQGP